MGSGRGAGGGGRGRGSKGDAEAPFIGRERRWRGGGAARGRWPAREHRGAPLMAWGQLGCLPASWSGASAEGVGVQGERWREVVEAAPREV